MNVTPKCPRCGQLDTVEGKIASSFILPQWGLFHSFRPTRSSGISEFRIQKKMLFCRSCGLLWQETR